MKESASAQPTFSRGRSFHLDALSSAVAINVDFDVALTVWAAAAYDARRRLPGYASATSQERRGRRSLAPSSRSSS